jgi:hypothetical protein
MKRVMMTVAALALAGTAQATELVRSEKVDLDIFGRGQMIGVYQNVPDPVRDNHRIYLFLKQARLGFSGRFQDQFRFETQFAYGGENANGSNTDLGMLDFVADVNVKPLGEDAVVKVGQFRVPYSREGLTDRGLMNYGERSIANLAQYQGRDYGIALQKKSGNLIGTIGTFSAGGRDVPQRYLPEVLGLPEMVVRVGYNDGMDQDIYHVAGTDLDLKRDAKAFYVNALVMQDTLIGHGVVNNLRTIDKNLLIDSSYNPYIAAGPNNAAGTAGTLQRGWIWFVGGDAAARKFISEKMSLEGEAEANYGGYDNRYGALHIASFRAQGGLRVDPYSVNLRWAGLLMDRQAGRLATTPNRIVNGGVGAMIHEITPSLVWNVKKHNLKLVADAPTYLNMPVFMEPGVGGYVFADQPGQNSYLGSGGNMRRSVITTARLMFQFMF